MGVSNYCTRDTAEQQAIQSSQSSCANKHRVCVPTLRFRVDFASRITIDHDGIRRETGLCKAFFVGVCSPSKPDFFSFVECFDYSIRRLRSEGLTLKSGHHRWYGGNKTLYHGENSCL